MAEVELAGIGSFTDGDGTIASTLETAGLLATEGLTERELLVTAAGGLASTGTTFTVGV
jgi:hypothetical protein